MTDQIAATPVSSTIDQVPAEIRIFLESILQDAGIRDLDDKTHEQMLQELFKRLDNYILLSISDNLPADKLEIFTRMAENKASAEQMKTYLQENIPDSTQIFAQAMLDFRDYYLSGMDKAQEKLSTNAAKA